MLFKTASSEVVSKPQLRIQGQGVAQIESGATTWRAGIFSIASLLSKADQE
jgi:hypothetical protein